MIFIQVNKIYVMTNVSVIHISVSLCRILPVHFALVSSRAPWLPFVFFNVSFNIYVTSGLFRTSYLSITLPISGYRCSVSIWMLLALSCIDLSSTFPIVQLQHGFTFPDLDPSQSPRLTETLVLFAFVWERKRKLKINKIKYVTSACIITDINILSTEMNAYHFFLWLSL